MGEIHHGSNRKSFPHSINNNLLVYFHNYLKLIMSDPIVTKLKDIKQNDKNLHQHLKQFVASLLMDRAGLNAFEAYSAQQRMAGGVAESVFKVR